MPPIVFPDDDGLHHCSFEWWYLNGHLESSEGKEYGFAWALFKLAKIPHPRVLHDYDFQSHFSLIDKQSKKHFSEVQQLPYHSLFSRLLPKKLDIKFKGVRLKQVSGDQFLLSLKGPSYALNFQLSSQAPVMLHGERGVVAMAESGSSFYYSRPRMEGNGRWFVNNQTLKGKAEVWMDHQWGSWKPNTVYWSWYAISLDNGVQIMIFNPYQINSSEKHFVTIQYPDGTQERLHEVKIEKLGIWQSPQTHIEYPTDGIFEISARESIHLRVVAISSVQEIDSGLAKYWEGACVVEGRMGETPIQGKAYAEIIGAYPHGRD